MKFDRILWQATKRRSARALLVTLEMYSRGRRGAPAKGVGRVTGARVQISPSPPKIRNTHSGVPYFSFCAESERFLTPTPPSAKRTAAQITKQSRVGKLAFQRGGEGCSRGGSPLGEHRCIAPRARSALAPRGSIVQITLGLIRSVPIRGAPCFFLWRSRSFRTPRRRRR